MWIKNNPCFFNKNKKQLLLSLDKTVNMVYIFFMSQTYQPNKRKRAKSHGFLVRSKTPGGKKVTQARRRKGRAKVSISK